MSDPRHRHPYDCIAFLDQRWDAMTAEMRAKAVQVEAELHMRIAALTSELAEARRQLGEADDKLVAIAGIVNGYHNDGVETSWDCLRDIATVLGPPWTDAEEGGPHGAGEAK